MGSKQKMRVLAHVAHGFGLDGWNKRHREGKLVGINDPFAYGYHRANDMGCEVTYSTDHEYNAIQRMIRIGLRIIFGFDLAHAFRNRHSFSKVDIIWTHTESQYLSILFLAMVANIKLPPMICQSVWLMDEFKSLSRFYRLLYLYLMKRADVLTFLSHLNAEVCKKILPSADIKVVRFGINGDTFFDKPERCRDGSVNIIAVGNDRHRDWSAVVEQFRDSGFNVRIVSGSAKMAEPLPRNIIIKPALTQNELVEAYMSADVALVALKPNLHASGVTAVLEAIIFATPVVVSNTGGLDGYFTEDEVYFADPLSENSLYAAAIQVIRDPLRATEKTRAAQRAFISSESYVAEHVAISRELLSKRNLVDSRIHCDAGSVRDRHGTEIRSPYA